MTARKLIIGLGVLITVAALAATSFTTNYNLAKPGDGDTNWGSSYRDNMDTIDTQMFIANEGIDDHIADTTGAHAATAISTSVGAATCLIADDVQEFLDCLDAQVAGLSGGSGVFLLSANNTATGDNTFNGTSAFNDTITASANVSFTGLGGTGILHSDSGGSLSSSAIVNADVDAAAAIARSKLAVGTADHVVINSGTGAFSSEAQLALTRGGTNASLTAVNGGVCYSTASALALSAAGTTGQILQSAGAASPTWSTATYPSTSGTTGTILRSDGTNFLNTTATYPNTTTANQILYSSATNTISEITTAATSALVTNSSSVPAFTSGAVANRLLRTDGTTISFAQASLTTDVTGTLPIANGGTNGTATATTGGVAYGTGTAYAFTAAGTTGQFLGSNGASAPTFKTFTAPTVQLFTTGSGTYTTPAGVLWIRVRLAGGGGGGAGSSTQAAADGGAGGAGGNTTFGTSLLTGAGASGAAGGVADGGAGGAGTINSPAVGSTRVGGRGQGPGTCNTASCQPQGGQGGANMFGAAGSGGRAGASGLAGGTNTGAGGGGGGAPSAGTSGGGGGAGGFVDAIIGTPDGTYSYAVGAAGTAGAAGTSGATGAAGAVGYIEVVEYYQ